MFLGVNRQAAVGNFPVQVGTVVEAKQDYYSARLTNKERSTHFVDEILKDQEIRKYAKRKFKGSCAIFLSLSYSSDACSPPLVRVIHRNAATNSSRWKGPDEASKDEASKKVWLNLVLHQLTFNLVLILLQQHQQM